VAALSARIAIDPLNGTVLGSARAHIGLSPQPSIWAATNPAGGVAARSSKNYGLVVSGPWDDEELDELATAAAALPDLVGIRGPEPLARRLVDALGSAHERLGRTVRIDPQRLYRLDELTEPAGVPGTARLAGRADADLLRAWYLAFQIELHGVTSGDVDLTVEQALTIGAAVLWLAGDEPVSLAVRRAPEGGSARIGPVYTPPERRGHGFAAAATAEATRQILEYGAIPVLFTDLNNPLTNRLYPRLGYYPVGDHLDITFT
jgi:GNAT superfamily N-acetyltransferase